MITCAECIERTKPDDPRVKSGRYHMCGCDYCNKPTYYIDLENSKPEVREVIHRHSDMSRKDFDLLQQTARSVKYLLELSNKRIEKKGNKYTIRP